MPEPPDPGRRLAAELRALGGLLGRAASDPPAWPAGSEQPGPLAGSGPRARGHEGDYGLLVTAVHEGYLQHYAQGRVLPVGEDPDLALLAGDRLFALGLARLAALGDLEGVGELADVISACAQAHAEDDPPRARAAWGAGAVAVGWGTSPAHERAKALARAGSPLSVDALEASRAARGAMA